MNRKITTIADARNIINNWVSGFVDVVPDTAIDRAARALVNHVGGYDKWLVSESDDYAGYKENLSTFNLEKWLGKY